MPKQSFFTWLIFFVSFGLAIPVWSQSTNPELNSDRPDRTQSPVVVPQRTIQIETGLRYQKDETDALLKKEYLYPETLIRIGILQWAELRLSSEFTKENQVLHTRNLPDRLESEKGFSRVQAGTKLSLYQGHGAIPDVGFLGTITLPVGNVNFRPEHAAPEGTMLFSNKITDKLELQYNVGYGKEPDEDTYLGQVFYSAVANLKLTDKLQGYAEYFAHKSNEKKAENDVDVGLMLLLLPNLQFDVVGGAGINEDAPDYFVGTGLTWRLPH